MWASCNILRDESLIYSDPHKNRVSTWKLKHVPLNLLSDAHTGYSHVLCILSMHPLRVSFVLKHQSQTSGERFATILAVMWFLPLCDSSYAISLYAYSHWIAE